MMLRGLKFGRDLVPPHICNSPKYMKISADFYQYVIKETVSRDGSIFSMLY
jgi:hypothetical protein